MRRPALVACVLLAVSACHQAPKADDGPRPLKDLGPRPAYVVSQAAVDRAVPAGVDAYAASRVVWVGGDPASVILERFVRGKCFLRERLAQSDDGRFLLAAIPARAAAGGGPMKPGLVLLSSVIDGPAGRGQGTLQRDPLGRIAWVYALGHARAKGQPRPEVVTRFRYGVHGCVLPRVLDRGAVPPKIRPAGAPDPGTR